MRPAYVKPLCSWPPPRSRSFALTARSAVPNGFDEPARRSCTESKYGGREIDRTPVKIDSERDRCCGDPWRPVLTVSRSDRGSCIPATRPRSSGTFKCRLLDPNRTDEFDIPHRRTKVCPASFFAHFSWLPLPAREFA